MKTPLKIQVKTHRLRMRRRKSQAQAMMMKNKGVGLKATNTTQEEASNKDNSIQVASLAQVSSRTHLSQHIHPSLHISSSRMCNTSTSGSNSKRTWPGTKTGVLLSSFKDSRSLDTNTKCGMIPCINSDLNS